MATVDPAGAAVKELPHTRVTSAEASQSMLELVAEIKERLEQVEDLVAHLVGPRRAVLHGVSDDFPLNGQASDVPAQQLGGAVEAALAARGIRVDRVAQRDQRDRILD